ncbi:MAG TPA: hypothetical protein VHB27_02195 [Rhodopila sp.]|uniref:hypothetical protein n=1 Tax=Rhodopila sp. TaxID=2480087 RepID=UPI002C90B5C2|nr:hypothetical protein [Rhodopila sp.]HVY14010.1 hypothetical protein [Rhodopila sp.]
MQIVDPDKQIAGRNWIVEIALFRVNRIARICIRLSCVARGDIGTFTPAVPSFVPLLAQKIGIENEGERIDSFPVHYGSVNIDDLVARLEDSQRKLPIVVVSEARPDLNRPWLLDINLLARNLTGLAWVFCISYEAAFGLSDALGKTWSVFNGACRIYMPGFDRFAQSPYDHPLIFGERLINTTWGESWLRRTIAFSSIDNADIYQRFPRFVTLRAKLAQRSYERRRADLTTEQQLEQIKDENDKLKRDVQEWMDLSSIAEEDQKVTRRDLDDVKRENAGLRSYIELLESTRKTGVEEGAERPTDYSGVPQWVVKTFSGRLVLSKKAEAAVMSSVYQDIGLVCDALQLLAMQYVDMRRHGDRRPIYEGRLRSLTLREEPIGASLDKFRSDSQYKCRYEGRELFTDRHLKKGNSRDPREILRIYFCWDEETRQVVVGHLTSHLETAIS